MAHALNICFRETKKFYYKYNNIQSYEKDCYLW